MPYALSFVPVSERVVEGGPLGIQGDITYLPKSLVGGWDVTARGAAAAGTWLARIV
jgi:hypothetical protein